MPNKVEKLVRSFGYAIKGVAKGILHERNMRIHISAAAAVAVLSQFYEFTTAEKCVLVLTVALVIICEMFNTAIENAVDLASPQYNKLAENAKDVAAGAVLIAAAAAAAVGCCLFWDLEVLLGIWHRFMAEPWLFGALAAFIAAALCFIFLPPDKNISEIIVSDKKEKEE